MIVFPNAKINLGLAITRRREDGYHDIETVMYPVGWTDILEIVPSPSGRTELFTSGHRVECPPEKNLVMKAYRALDAIAPLPPVSIYLHKVIPDGAGLGGGSADAAFTLRALNTMFALGIDNRQLQETAATIGADCPFFISDTPVMATGMGTTFTPAGVSLAGYTIVIVKPAGSVSTREAYAGVTSYSAPGRVADALSMPISQWQGPLSQHSSQKWRLSSGALSPWEPHMPPCRGRDRRSTDCLTVTFWQKRSAESSRHPTPMSVVLTD